MAVMTRPGTTNRVSIVIPLYNQLAYTKGCLESLRETTAADAEIILVDNASADGTSDFLATLTDVTIIANRENLGCACAWNQGAQSATGEWIVILNNDVLLSKGWLKGLLSAAARWKLDIVTPAIREGVLNYDVHEYGQELTRRMHSVIRRDMANGICFMVHRRVFDSIGYFDENFRIGQYEDTDFFRRAKYAGFHLGMVGCSFLHHFGSVTQNSISVTKTLKPYAVENKAYFIRKWKLPWWKRALERNSAKLINWSHCTLERLQYGHSLIEAWKDKRLKYY